MDALAIDNQPITTYTLDGQKLDVTLPQPLLAGGTLTLTMNYGLVLPPMSAYSNAEDVRPQIYGYMKAMIYPNQFRWQSHSRGV